MILVSLVAAVFLAVAADTGSPAGGDSAPGAAAADSISLAAVATTDSLPPPGTPVYSMPEIRVFGKRPASEWSRLPLSTTTIDRAAIEASGAISAGDVLRPLAGVRVATLGGIGSYTPLSIRGSSNGQVVVLVDGRRLNTAQGGGVDLSDLPLEGVERVEVARGGASALFGPDALGGAINLVTRQVTESRSLDLRGEVGSFDTAIISGTAGLRSERLSGRFSGRVLDSRGDYDLEDGSGEPAHRVNGEITSRAGELALDWNSSDGSRLGLGLSHYRAVKGVPGPTEFPSPTAEQTDERSAIDLQVPVLPALGLSILGGADAVTRVAAFGSRQIRLFEDPGYPLGAIDDSHRNDALGVSIEQRRRLAAAGDLLAGFEFREDRLQSTTDGDRLRPARAVYARTTLGPSGGAWSIVPALRYDDVADYDGTLSPRVLGTYRLSSEAGLRASTGRAFRPPSFDDLFFPARATAAGNPNLRPEKSTDADLGITWERESRTLAFTAFASRITDLIQWQPGAGGFWRPHNVEGARLLGFETEVRGPVPAFGFLDKPWFEVNYTFLDPRETGDDRNTGGKVLVYRPRHRANLNLRLPSGRWTVENAWRYTGKVYTTRANTKTLPAYLVGDLALFWRAQREVRMELRALNLTDATYQDVRDYPVPGRQWRLALTWNTEDAE